MFRDARGILHSLKALPFEPKEILVSENEANVFRGMHQSPYPKIIYVVNGQIEDFFWSDSLTRKVLGPGESLLVPAYAAHGFTTLEKSTVVYLLGGEFDPALDKNFHWSTPGWGIPDMMGKCTSAKDAAARWAQQFDYIVLGASGYLGTECVKHLRAQGRTVFESAARLEDQAAIKHQLEKSGAKYVVCAAGISGRPTIQWCETHELETIGTNFLSVLELMETCEDVHLTIFGSGAVYSGSEPVYTEEDPPDFFETVYSKWRCRLEEHVKGHVLYLRIMYPCTFDSHPKCFQTKMRARRGNVHDAQVSITPVPFLFPHLPTLIERGLEGIFNFVSDGPISLATIAGDPAPHGAATRGGYELSAQKLSAFIPVIKTTEVFQICDSLLPGDSASSDQTL